MKIHLDLDCYFVSAERTRYPFLKGKNVVVAKSSDQRIFSYEHKQGVVLGDTGAFNSVMEFKNNYPSQAFSRWREAFMDEEGKIHGIVIAKSYEAKKYGIKTGTPLKEALLMCDEGLIILPSDHLFYQELSQKLKAYLETQIPLLEQYSIDEFFGDLNGWIKEEDTQEFITQLRDDILEKFDLPITIGASHSKWIAKLITDKAKPFGAMVVPKEKVADFTKEIRIEEFPGVGRAVEHKLRSCGIKTMGELQGKPSLLKCYGKTGRNLYARMQGIDEEPVIAHHDRRSIGISRNFKAIHQREEIHRRVTILARYLSHTIVKLQLNPTTFYFKIRYEYGLKSKLSVTEHRLFNERFYIDLAHRIFKQLDNHPGYKIHYIAMNASNFITKANLKTFSLIEYSKDTKMASLTTQMAKIRDKYGVDMVRYGVEQGELFNLKNG